MSVRVRLRAEAEQDLYEAALWYEAQRESLGGEFLDEALSVLAKVSESPLAYPELHRGARRALLDRFPFGVFFRLEETEAIVIAVMHGSRDPMRWKGRT